MRVLEGVDPRPAEVRVRTPEGETLGDKLRLAELRRLLLLMRLRGPALDPSLLLLSDRPKEPKFFDLKLLRDVRLTLLRRESDEAGEP